MFRPFDSCSHIKIKGRKYLYLNDDDPSAAYHSDDISFVAQPLADARINKKHNVITVPLMMSDEWQIIKDNPELIKSLRENRKENDFNFVGQCNYTGRDVFRRLNLKNYDFEETLPVYSLSKRGKAHKLINFLYRISKSKFVFAPRGIGSSSFRAYQAMMVGSIPIITGMNDYPFRHDVDWGEISINGKLSELNSLIEKALGMSEHQYNVTRERAMCFWSNYCKHDMLYEKLENIILNL